MAKLKSWQDRLKDNDFPEPAPWKTPEECQAAYESGFPGAYLDEENWASIPSADSILDGFGAGDTGEGELVLAHPELYKASGKQDWWEGNPAQAVGDCLTSDSIVTLADGKKQIKDVEIGDKVRTPSHGDQEVKSLFRKSFDGDLFNVEFGSLKVQCTPDHLFLTPSKAWIAAEDLKKGDAVVGESEVLYVSNVSSKKWSGTVYCFEVEEAHCFFANGIAVHNCVSHSTRNALMLSLACQITRGKGSESWPDNIPDHAYKSMSCYSPVILYNTRSNAPGHGWSCPTSVKNSESIVGLVPACDYTNTPGVNRDYSKYSGKQTTEFGRSGPPKEYFEALNGHRCEGSAKISGRSELIRFMKNGFFPSTCGSEGFSSSRDQYGEAKRKGSWSHALVFAGYDDTKWAHDHFGETAILVCNSWGPGACKGPREIHGDPSMGLIPKNGWWTPYSKVKSRHCTAITAVKGWPPAKLPNWAERMEGLI